MCESPPQLPLRLQSGDYTKLIILLCEVSVIIYLLPYTYLLS